ncbi:hypothetical protein PQ455_01680 [Sphingomonas naphthae]|uniref:Integrase n=1 Tax=Sphingomonas naphthae TaxID=1813468 RepID=A0ABY7TLW5_9SPHN|nr:hypothetical protein [Sphingomonas naphthae]WCT73971.1 hypothetical protein PQ455_01680 [Sphingomonas naphthae]
MLRMPAYVQARKLAGGAISYYWVRPKWASPPAMRHDRMCPVVSTALGADPAAAIPRADALNAAFKEWRLGAGRTELVPGSVRWLFDWYRKSERYTTKAWKTRKGYKVAMDGVEAMAMKIGIFGDRQAGAIDAPAADKLYARARAKHGERQGSYMMQVCRLVWNQAMRPGYSKATGVKANPFSGMGIKSTSGTGNRAATRAEYDAYRATARAMGKQSMATAAAICFEGCQRVYDAFGFEDPDKKVRGVMWRDYRPGERISLIQSKTGNLVKIPLVDSIDGEAVVLYPDLEEELGRMVRREDGGLIGEAYDVDYMAKLHRRIRKKAGLPSDLRFTGFRHGGITEIGDAGEDDVRAVSGHKTLDITAIYNKASEAKGRRIALKRREHVALITAGDTVEGDENEP